ncbi:MAG: NAD(P)H-hydrate dehydratase [Deltaproteobacteria bacterium]|nr:MAG: NAD(P)H-hydrate dehydratase [Deltaproteobacteria bacterium]
MRRGSWPLVTADAMRALDRHTIETLGVPGDVLMESAGRAVAAAALERLPRGGSVIVVCGSGNNGGDGLVAARQLHGLGVPVRVLCVAEPEALGGDAARNLARARALDVPVEGPRWLGAAANPSAGRAAGGAVIVDAIFGTGLTRAVDGAAARAIQAIDGWREGGGCVVAVDLPSGLHADTGAVLGVAVRADVTVTISLPKLGLALEPGRSHAGRIVVARIGIADTAPDARAGAALWTRAAAGSVLPERPAGGHKGTFGHVFVVAGSPGKTGAAALAARGAGRAGAGLVTLGCPAGIADILEVKCTEAMTAALPDTAERCLAASAEKPILALGAERQAVALGPGLGVHPETVALVRSVVAGLDVPLVIDADGLNALAGAAAALQGRRAPTILTPHPGEAARLLGTTGEAINRDRVAAARRLARESGAVVLLKGAASVVAEPGGAALVNPTGGSELATGGTGDVLTGVVAAFVAQGAAPFDAAALAAYLHGLAGDRIAAREGPAGLQASDLADALPEAARVLREAASELADPLGAGLAVSFPEP